MHHLASSQSHRKPIAGIPCDFISHEEFLDFIQDALSRKPTDSRLSHIVTLNAEMVVEAQKNAQFREILNRSTVNIPDGSSLLWANEYLQKRKGLLISLVQFLFSKQHPLTGIDSIFDICAALEQVQGAAYLLGGEEADRNATATILQEKYPGLAIVTLNDNTPLTPSLSQNRRGERQPSAIFVALGAPKQTVWIEEHRGDLETNGITIAMGVGGAFAMISGRLPRAPRIMRRFHLEWLWRLFLEPQRLRRIYTAIIVFPTLIRGYPH